MSAQPGLRLALGPMSPHWTGGIEYYRLLRAAFAHLPEEERPVTGIVAWDAEASATWAGDLADERIVVPSGSVGIPVHRRIMNKLHRTLRLPVPTLTATEAVLMRFGADVLFGTQVFRDIRGIPLLGWIPDFQYSHMPHIYGEDGAQRTHAAAHAIARRARRLIMSSEAVKSDLARLFPEAVAKARVVRFVSPIPQAIYETDPGWVCDAYHLPERFLYIPNQFWAHKNHHLVLEALGMEPARSAGVVVVCTGNAHDARHPTFFGELLAAVSAAGARDRMILLGLVPRDHVLPLMRQSTALLQPSKFEGWNIGIEEAKSLGKAVLASDIPVHREQDPPGGVYFRLNDAQDLSDKMAQVWNERKPGPDIALEQQARADLPGRMVAFARAFVNAAREAAEKGL